MIALPISIVFLFLQKYLVSGLTAGATKAKRLQNKQSTHTLLVFRD